MRRRVQQLDHQGRHLLPDDGEEAPAGAGDRAREPAALHLSRRLRRRQPAASDRGVPRPRAFRAHLLQSGDAVGARHSADRGGDGIVHGRRRLRAGDVRRDHHRAPAGHDLPRRAAAGEGGDRRGGLGGGSRRRRRARATLRRRRPLRGGRRACARARAAHRRSPQHQAERRARATRAARSGATTRPSSTASCRRTCASSTTCAR